MKIFKLLLALLCAFLFQVNVNAQYYETVESVLFYKTPMSAKVHSIIPAGVVLKLESDISSTMVRTKYKGISGFIRKDVIGGKLKEIEEPVIKDQSGDDLTTNRLFIDQDLLVDIEQLAAYNKSYRSSLNALYITTGISVVTMMMGSIFVASDRALGAGAAMFAIGGMAGAGSLISGICALEFQNKINKQNIKVHLKANGVSVAF